MYNLYLFFIAIMKRSNCCSHFVGVDRSSNLFKDTQLSIGSWALSLVWGMPCSVFFPLHHVADGGITKPLGLRCFLSFIRERMKIPGEFGPLYVSLPAKHTVIPQTATKQVRRDTPRVLQPWEEAITNFAASNSTQPINVPTHQWA